MSEFQILESAAGLADVPGFLNAGVAADFRRKGDGRLDLALLFSPTPCTAAGVFTTNQVVAAPVKYCRQVLAQSDTIHGIIANSGNANACTGEQGMKDAIWMGQETARLLQLPAGSIFVCSTGRIGEPLSQSALQSGIPAVVQALSDTEESGAAASSAILTSDTRPKTVTVREQSGKFTVAGIAKGAGMIEPAMATMLAFLGTDAAVPSVLLQKVLSDSLKQSFNAITVDGDRSTNDTVLLLANGSSGVVIDSENHPLFPVFKDMVQAACTNLALKIVGDGEKISHVVTLEIEGAESEQDAFLVARSIGNSLLVKSSWCGGDPNWGRLISSAGASSARVVEEKLDLYYNSVPALLQGQPLVENKPLWKKEVANREFCIRLNLNLGTGRCRFYATDLTEAYVNFNKSE
jgi:glutamate N-acetyltransferase/amino-acid N-acetyltransferase